MIQRLQILNIHLKISKLTDAYLFWILPAIQIICIRLLAGAGLHRSLIVCLLFLAVLSLSASYIYREKVHSLMDSASVGDLKRRRSKTVVFAVILILTAIQIYKQFYSRQQWVEAALQEEGDAPLQSVVVLSNGVNAWGNIEQILETESRVKIRFTASANDVGDATLFEQMSSLEYGAQMLLSLDYYALGEAQNPGAFDEGDYYFSQGIFASAKLSDSSELTILDTTTRFSFIQRQANRLNETISLFFIDLFGQEPGALAAAMFLGNEDYLGKAIKDNFKLSGLSHLLVVSGSNVSLVFTFMMPFLERSGIKWKFRQAFLLPALLLFGYLINWDASVTRAIAMNLVLIVARLGKRPIRASTALGIAVTVILALKPVSALQIGFLMSVMVSFALIEVVNLLIDRIIDCSLAKKSWRRKWILLSQARQNHFRSLIMALVTPVISQLAVMPFTIEMGSVYSWLAIPLNWLAVPLAGALSILLTLLSPFAFMGFMIPGSALRLIGLPAQTLIIAVSQLSNLPSVLGVQGRPISSRFIYLYALILLLIFGFIRAWKKQRLLRVAGSWVLITCLLLAVQYLKAPAMQLYFLSVGQGDAALIRLKNGQSMLIDTGTEIEGMQVIPTALQELGIRKIDLMIVSHFDQDHVGALSALMDGAWIRAVASPLPTKKVGKDYDEERAYQASLEEQASDSGVDWQYLKAGDRIDMGFGQYMSCIYPAGEDVGGGNDSSLVLLLNSYNLEVLFTGDTEKVGEQDLLRKNLLSDVDILKVSHHGSKTSSHPDFLDAIQAEMALISVGKNNYGHPYPAVLQSLEERAVLTFRTDLDGALVVESDKRKWTAYRFRDPKTVWKGK